VSLRVRFKPAAERDVESAFRWYEDHRSGLGSEFLAALDSAVSLIVSNPEVSPVVRVRVRRAVLRRFPYLLFYVIESSSRTRSLFSPACTRAAIPRDGPHRNRAPLRTAADVNPRRVSRSLLLLRVRVGAAEC
jgi:toxin ParE1/3/4